MPVSAHNLDLHIMPTLDTSHKLQTSAEKGTETNISNIISDLKAVCLPAVGDVIQTTNHMQGPDYIHVCTRQEVTFI